MNDKQRAKWEKMRAKGMWRFVLLYGVLWWGTFMIVGTSAYDYFLRHRSLSEELYISVPVYLVGGMVFGLAMWLVGEYQYRRSTGGLR